MYIFHNTVISNFLSLRILIFMAVVERVIPAHHRIVIKDRDHLPAKENKHKSAYIPKVKKPDSYNIFEDEVVSITTEDYYETHNRNKHFVNKTGRFKSRTTTPREPNFADLIEITTPFSQKLSLPIYESTFNQYYTQKNISYDLQASNSYKQPSSINFNKLLSPKEEIIHFRKNYSQPQPYEVHEDIHEDIYSTSPVTPRNITKFENIYYNHKYT